MSIPKHPCGTYPAAVRMAAALDESHQYVAGPRGECLECQLQEQIRRDARNDQSDYARRRRNFFVGLFYGGLAVLIVTLWLAGKLHGQTPAPAPTQITPRQIRGLASLVVMQCAGVTGSTPVLNPDGTPVLNPDGTPKVLTQDCTGLYYVDLVRADGTELKIMGTPVPPGATIDPTHWTVLP